MGRTSKDWRNRLQRADMSIRLMIFTVSVTLLIWLLHGILSLFGAMDPFLIERKLWLVPDLYSFLRHPWTFFTYIWLHSDVFHLIFNMLWLYWFGQLFIRYHNQKQLLSVFLLGGMAGGLLYVPIVLLLDSLGVALPHFPLIGSSGSVMAIVFGIAFYAHWERVNLFLIGSIKLTTLAIGLFVLDIILLSGNNFGGHIAHIGGALLGLWFAYSLRKGHDITVWFQRIIDRFVNMLRSLNNRRYFKKTFRVSKKGQKSQDKSKQNTGKQTDTNSDQADIDEILDKIRISGYTSLTTEEKRRLFDRSKQL